MIVECPRCVRLFVYCPYCGRKLEQPGTEIRVFIVDCHGAVDAESN